MSVGHWILGGPEKTTPMRAEDVFGPDPLIPWARWMDHANCTVRLTLVHARDPDRDAITEIRVSTVFLGLDHSFGGSRPLLFETMIFGAPEAFFDGEYQTRCEEYGDAVQMHRRAIDELTLALAVHRWGEPSLIEGEGTLENP